MMSVLSSVPSAIAPMDDHGTAERPAGVDLLTEADELDLLMVELIEHLEFRAPRKRFPNRKQCRDTSACVCSKLRSRRWFCFRFPLKDLKIQNENRVQDRDQQ